MPGSHPYSRRTTLMNPLARMLPIQREQFQVYRMGERLPPSGGLHNHAPMWEAISFVLGPLQTAQARVNLQRDFNLLAILISNSSNVAGGFRGQMYDTRKKLRLADRGVQQALMGGNMTALSGPFFLREPYPFDQPDSQILVQATNLEAVTNTIQIALYGLVLRFNQDFTGAQQFPGGPIPSRV
jgi:hypothetical protein